MTTTPNLGIEHLIASAKQKTPAFNTGLDDLDRATQETLDLTVTGATVLTAAQYTEHHVMVLNGTPGSPFNLTAPDGDRTFEVWNLTDAVATVKATSSGDTVAVAPDSRSIIHADGVDMERFGSGAGVMHDYLPAGGFVPAQALGCGDLASFETTSGNPDIVGMPFSNTVEERAQIHFVFPDRWNLGALLYQLEYAHIGGQTGGLDGTAWLVDAVAVAGGGSLFVTFGTPVGVTADLSAADTLHRPPLSGLLTIAGVPTEGELVILRVRREIDNGADDLDIDAIFVGLRLIWTTNDSVDD